MSANLPTAPTPPSTWITGVGTLIAGGTVATFLVDSSISAHTVAAVTALGLVIIAVGSWLHQIGH